MTSPYRGLIWSAETGEQERRLTKPGIYLLLAVVVVILGLNWPLMATALRTIPPVWMAVFRVSGAAVVVIALGAFTGNLRVPPGRDLPMIASVAIFRLGAVMVLVFFALTLVPAGRASVLVWTTSLWTVPIAAIFLGERMTSRKWAGLAIGLPGILILAEPWGNDWSDPGVIIGTLLLLSAAILSASTAVHIRGHRWTITPLEAMPWQLIGAAIPLTILALVVDGVPVIDWTPQLAWIVVYQGVLGTGLAFWAQIVVLRNLSAVSTNLTLMGVPVVGVISSAILLDESITTALVVGMAMIIAGVALNLLADRADLPVGGGD